MPPLAEDPQPMPPLAEDPQPMPPLAEDPQPIPPPAEYPHIPPPEYPHIPPPAEYPHIPPPADYPQLIPSPAQHPQPIPPLAQHPRGSGHRPPLRRSWVYAVTALVVLAAAGSAAFVLVNNHRGRGGSPKVTAPPNEFHSSPAGRASSTLSSEQAELAQITPLLQLSASARGVVVNATQRVGACTMAASDGISLMNQAISRRQAIIKGIASLSVDAIPDGQQMIADLTQATQQSIVADQGFIGWMQDMQDSATCPIDTSTDSSYGAGLEASAKAVQGKQEFAALWNPLASQFGQPTFNASEI